MRAIAGTVLSSKPCSLAKAARILSLFADSTASHLPSPDAATYLRTANDATNDHHLFRRELRRYQQQGGDLQAFMPEEEIDIEKKGNKKKKHMKQEEEARGAKGVVGKIVRDGVAEQGIAGEEKKRTKMKHTEEDDEKKEKIVTDGDMGSDKKRKKKRGRGDHNDNDKELVEHTKKKQRKHPGN